MTLAPVFLFDADCGLCQSGTDRIRSQAQPTISIRAYQSVDLDELGVSLADVHEGPVLVRGDGSGVIGPRAVAELLRSGRKPYRLVGRVMLAPGVRQLLAAVGPTMYRNKHRLPGANDACGIPARPHEDWSTR